MKRLNFPIFIQVLKFEQGRLHQVLTLRMEIQQNWIQGAVSERVIIMTAKTIQYLINKRKI
jgi:hypothetical protein